MGVIDIILISVGLAMDAFAVSICKGLSIKVINLKKTLVVGMYFGSFQMLMPAIGFMLGARFDETLDSIAHWLAFILLSCIGLKMLKESFNECDDNFNDKVDFKTMFVLAIATSIDALAVGISYAFLDVSNCMIAFFMIGIITFILSMLGVIVGNKFGNKFGTKAELIGGIILICMGTKILLEYLNIL